MDNGSLSVIQKFWSLDQHTMVYCFFFLFLIHESLTYFYFLTFKTDFDEMKKVVRKLPWWALPICVGWEGLWNDSPELNLFPENLDAMGFFSGMDMWEEMKDSNGNVIGYRGKQNINFLFYCEKIEKKLFWCAGALQYCEKEGKLISRQEFNEMMKNNQFGSYIGGKNRDRFFITLFVTKNESEKENEMGIPITFLVDSGFIFFFWIS